MKKIIGKTIVELKNTELSYANKTIITGLNKTILEGQCIIISGSNGSGKTSLLNILMGHVKPNKGQVIELPELKKGFFTNPTIENFFSLTVADELKLGNHTNKSIFDLEKLMGRFVFDLSQGQQRQVALGLLNNSSLNLLLLDEPFLHLDSQATQKLLDFIQLLKNSNIAVVITAHDPAFFQALADQQWDLGGLQ